MLATTFLYRYQQVIDHSHKQVEFIRTVARRGLEQMTVRVVRIHPHQGAHQVLQRFGEEPVDHEEQHQPDNHGPGDANQEGECRALHPGRRRRSGVVGDAEPSVNNGFAAGDDVIALKVGGVGAGRVENQVGQVPVTGIRQWPLVLGQDFTIGVGDGGFVQFLLTEQAADDLGTKGIVKTEYGLGGRVADKFNGLQGVVVQLRGDVTGVADNLYHAQHTARDNGGRQYPAKNPEAQAALQ